jgi:16S rRNA U516 pseudouridylate synthase RsuA-like enzyme
MFKHFGRLVEKLKRVKIGPLDLGPLQPGAFRYLSQAEVEQLRKAMQRGVAETPRKPRKRFLSASASRR